MNLLTFVLRPAIFLSVSTGVESGIGMTTPARMLTVSSEAGTVVRVANCAPTRGATANIAAAAARAK